MGSGSPKRQPARRGQQGVTTLSHTLYVPLKLLLTLNSYCELFPCQVQLNSHLHLGLRASPLLSQRLKTLAENPVELIPGLLFPLKPDTRNA